MQVLAALEHLQQALRPMQALLLAHDMNLRAAASELRLLQQQQQQQARQWQRLEHQQQQQQHHHRQQPGRLLERLQPPREGDGGPLRCDMQLSGLWAVAGAGSLPRLQLAVAVQLLNSSQQHGLGPGWQLLLSFAPEHAAAPGWQSTAALPQLPPGASCTAQLLLPLVEGLASTASGGRTPLGAAWPPAAGGLGPGAFLGSSVAGARVGSCLGGAAWLGGGTLTAHLVRPLLAPGAGAQAACLLLRRRRVTAAELGRLAAGNAAAAAVVMPEPASGQLLWDSHHCLQQQQAAVAALQAVADTRVGRGATGGGEAKAFSCSLMFAAPAPAAAAGGHKRRCLGEGTDGRPQQDQQQGEGPVACRADAEALLAAVGDWVEGAVYGSGSADRPQPRPCGLDLPRQRQVSVSLGSQSVQVSWGLDGSPAAHQPPDGSGVQPAVRVALRAGSVPALAAVHGSLMAAATEALPGSGAGHSGACGGMELVGSLQGMQAALQRLQALRGRLRQVRGSCEELVGWRQRCDAAAAAAAGAGGGGSSASLQAVDAEAALEKARQVRSAVESAYGRLLGAVGGGAWQLRPT